MIYKNKKIILSTEERKSINSKILSVINKETLDEEITKEYIYNNYTGKGGLHGLNLGDYTSFYEFSEDKKAFENGQFFTNHELCKYVCDILKITENDKIADITCGMGNFFNWLPNQKNIYGCEIDTDAYKVAKYLYPNINIECNDLVYYDCPIKLNFVIGNPPFNIKWKGGKSQFVFMKKAYDFLEYGAFFAVIMPDSFLKDEYTTGNERKTIEKLFNFIGQTSLPRNCFKQVGIKNLNTKLMIFQKKSDFLPKRIYTNTYIKKEELEKKLAEAQALKNSLLKNIILENKRKQTDDFEYQYKKYLYQIKTIPTLKSKIAKCEERYKKFKEQIKPPSMSVEEWEQKKMTHAKVIKYMKKLVKNQHIIPKDEIKLVKTPYGLKLKPYSKKMSKILKESKTVTSMSFNDMVLRKEYPFEDKTYLKLYKLKSKQFENQSIDFESLKPQKNLLEYTNRLVIHDYRDGKNKRLNKTQKMDVAKVLSKRYSLLNWSMGSGKSLAAYAWFNYHLKNKTVRNVFLISHALAIYLHWAKMLKNPVIIEKPDDLQKIKTGDVVLIDFHFLNKNKYQIKKYLKLIKYKAALVFDESDEITSEYTKKSKDVIDVFRRCKYKLLTTGTATRNNISEMYNQFELLYNNSINMICDSQIIFREDIKSKIINQCINFEYYMKPFPAKGGYSLFRQCYNPVKKTVFGVSQNTQDIYNMNSLAKLISKTIITKTFKDVVGEDKYIIKNILVEHNPDEELLYEKIVDDFHKMMYKYFRDTGEFRKESALKLIRQIQTLIKASSLPQYFDEYNGDTPNKMKKIAEIVREKPNEMFAIGCTMLEAVNEYYKLLKNEPRPVFIKTGLINRKQTDKILKDFNNSKNGILICTQQSLRSAVNIPNCRNVIAESLQWNIPKMFQFIFRFIRYDSRGTTNILIVSYKNSIEQNLLALLMAKEKLNDFVKTQQFKENSEIFEEYGIEPSILDGLIEKNYDSKGKSFLSWGRQKAS